MIWWDWVLSPLVQAALRINFPSQTCSGTAGESWREEAKSVCE